MRYLSALLRYRWVVMLALAAGVGAAFVGRRAVRPAYLAHGSLWVNDRRPTSESGPIQEGEMLQASAWVDLLRSSAVLSPVVMQERLYLSHSAAQDALFQDLEVHEGPDFRPGRYRLEVPADGRSYRLLDESGELVETARIGEPIGKSIGLRWNPGAALLAPGLESPFFLVSPQDATEQLRGRLAARMDPMGTFIQLELSDVDRRRAASLLGAVMERDVEIAGQLKRSRLTETTKVLSDQLASVEKDLKSAESSLETFRVQTITLPTDVSSPITPGVQQTRARVLDDFFDLRSQEDQLREGRQRLEAALVPDQSGGIRVSALETIPAVLSSSELVRSLQELAAARTALAEVRRRFTDQHEQVVAASQKVALLERTTIPTQAGVVVAEMKSREAELALTVSSRSRELAGIPPRVIEEARLERSVKIANDLYLDLRQRYESASLAMASAAPDVQILDRPSVPTFPESDDRARMALLAFAGVLCCGLGAVFLLDRMDPRLRDPLDVSGEMGLPVLATVPRLRPSKADSLTQVREAFRDLRTNVEFAYGPVRPLVLCVTSPSAREGKSFVSAHLAIALAEMGRRTLLVDADTRRGDAHEVFGLARKPGLTEFLSGSDGTGAPVQKSEHRNLWVLSSGARSSRSPDLLSSGRMQELLAAAKQRFDVVIVDSPPLSAGADAFVLAAHAGSLLVVLRSGSTNKALTLVKMEPLLRLPVRVLGAVLNDFAPSALGSYRYYGNYLDEYAPTDEPLEGSNVALTAGAHHPTAVEA